MKKHLLLPFLFIALFFSACTPDEDVDMPIPDMKTPSEMIQGDWLNYESIYTAHRATDEVLVTTAVEKYKFEADSVYLETFNDGNFLLPYHLSEKNNKTYISYGIWDVYMPQEYEIVSITDSTMTWRKEDTNYEKDSTGVEVSFQVTAVEKFRRK